MFVWQTLSEANDRYYVMPLVKHDDSVIMVWVAISWYTAGHITLKGRVPVYYVHILPNHVHSMVQTLFLKDNTIYQDDNALNTASVDKSWIDEHADEVLHLPRVPQSPDLNIIEPLRSILETKVWTHFPALLRELE